MSAAPRPSGYIKLARKQFDGHDALWADGTPYDSRSAWTDLIQLAAYQSYAYRGVDPLERGEFVAAVRFLAERWKWSKSKTQRWLKSVEQMGRIVGRRMGQHGRVYLLVNYDAYQSGDGEGGTPDGTQTDAAVGRKRDRSGTNEKTVKAVKAKRGADADASGPPSDSWVARLTAKWVSRVGTITHGRLGAALKPHVEEFGEAIVASAMDLWLAGRNGRPARFAWFAESCAECCRRAITLRDQPLDEGGWMTPEFELATRPAGLKIA